MTCAKEPGTIGINETWLKEFVNKQLEPLNAQVENLVEKDIESSRKISDLQKLVYMLSYENDHGTSLGMFRIGQELDEMASDVSKEIDENNSRWSFVENLSQDLISLDRTVDTLSQKIDKLQEGKTSGHTIANLRSVCLSKSEVQALATAVEEYLVNNSKWLSATNEGFRHDFNSIRYRLKLLLNDSSFVNLS